MNFESVANRIRLMVPKDWNPNTCGCDRCSACSNGNWPALDVRVEDALIALKKEYPDAYIKWDEHALYMYTGTDSALFCGWILGKPFQEQEERTIDFFQDVL